MPKTDPLDLTSSIAANLPFLRRFARALTGSQQTGDRYAAAALEAILEGSEAGGPASGTKVHLFHVFHIVWSSAGAPVGDADSRASARAQQHMAKLTHNSREALILHAIEGFTVEEVGAILGVAPAEASEFIDIARREMKQAVTGKVMIIEDEAIIAMDISAIVEDAGHKITGIARTRTEAVQLAANDPPDLILADIQLADNSSGIDAVNDILVQFEGLPVIFVTAFPRRLLTGERPEPTFVITKPFTEDEIRSAVSQAMFFSSVETLAT